MQTVAPRTVETPGTKASPHEVALRTSPDDGSSLQFILLTSDSGQLITRYSQQSSNYKKRTYSDQQDSSRIIGFYIRDNSIHIHFTFYDCHNIHAYIVTA